MKGFSLLLFGLVSALFSGCATQPKDYTAFRAHQPKSILVLPPLNESTDVLGGYSVLTTTTRPLSELGYYVFPVVLVDQFLKENGLPTPGEMHQAPLQKLHEVFGADAVLYIVVEQYGSKYHVISSDTTVTVRAHLVDCATSTVLWEGRRSFTQSSSSGNLLADVVGAVVNQVLNKMTDHAHPVAAVATFQLLCPPNQGLLLGPRNPKFGEAAK